MNFINKIVERFPFLKQAFRFAVIGFINTGIDFVILNALMWATDIYEGRWILLLNLISFAVATTNSYFWNKRWAFQDDSKGKDAVLFSQFFVVSIIGAGINSGTVFLITTYVTPMFGIGEGLWANIAKVAATCISLIWNFSGYKFVVFKK